MDELKPHIAIVSRNMAGRGGTTTTVYEHARRLAEQGREVHLYAEKFDRKRARASGAIRHYQPGFPLGKTYHRFFFDRVVQWRIKDRRFAVVHGHGDLLRQDILSLHNCVHRTHEEIYGASMPDEGVARFHREMLSLQQFRGLIANSQLMKNDLVERFAIPPSLIHVIYPGFDPSRFNMQDRDRYREPARQKLGIKPLDVLLGMITSGDLKKRGVDILIQALAKLTPRSKEKCQLLIIGKERNWRFYRNELRKVAVGVSVHFLNDASLVQQYFHAMDIFVYPAYFEEFGQSVQEAMACGVPVLTHSLVGAAELYGEEANIVLPNRDPAAFASGIDQLVDSKSQRLAWRETGLKKVRFNTWDKNFHDTWALYQTINKAGIIRH